jgi:nucleotide-binding universal stress UspA family protein
VDPSECAMRAVDHAGFMLAGVEQPVTLFYSRRNLLRFVPREALEAAPGLETVWQSRAGKEISPVMDKARHLLVQAGVAESRIAVKVVEGSRSAGANIIEAARQEACSTIVVGRHGETSHKAFPMGSVARTVVQQCDDTAVWVVPKGSRKNNFRFVLHLLRIRLQFLPKPFATSKRTKKDGSKSRTCNFSDKASILCLWVQFSESTAIDFFS